jgi:hypothetical protein
VHHLLSVLHMDCCMGCWLAFAKYSRYHAELKVRGVHGHLHSFTIVWKESGAIMLRDRGVCVGPTHTAEHCQKSCRNQQIFKSDSSRWSRSAHAFPATGPRDCAARACQSADMHPTVQNVLAWFAGAVVSIPANMMLLEPMGKLLGAPPAPNVRPRGVSLCSCIFTARPLSCPSPPCT